MLGRMMPMALMRILFYLDQPHLLLVVAVASKHMNGMAKHDVLWRLTITDKRDTSGVALLAKSCELLEKGAEYGIASPTDAQLAALGNPNTHLWFRFHIDVTREGIRREKGGEAVLTAAKGGDVPKLRKLLWAMVNIEARDSYEGYTERCNYCS